MSTETSIFVVVVGLVFLLIASIVVIVKFSEQDKKRKIEQRMHLTAKINRISYLEDILSKLDHIPHTNITELSIKLEILSILKEMEALDSSKQILMRIAMAQDEVDSLKSSIGTIQNKGTRSSSSERQARIKIKFIQDVIKQISKTSVRNVDLIKYFNDERNRLVNESYKIRISLFEDMLYAAESKNELGRISAIGSKLIGALQAEGSQESLSAADEVRIKVDQANRDILLMKRKKISEKNEKERDEDEEMFSVKKVW